MVCPGEKPSHNTSLFLCLLEGYGGWHVTVTPHKGQRTRVLGDQWSMVLGNPLLDECAKLLGFLSEFFRLRLRHNVGGVIVEQVALAPTGIKVAHEIGYPCSESKFDSFKGGLVMSTPDDPIPGTRNGHFGQLKDRIIGRSKLAVRGEARDTGIFEVSRNDRAQTFKLSVACGVGLNAVVCL